MAQMAGLRWHDWLLSVGQNGCFYSSANIRRPEDASGLVAARRAARVSQVRAASILGTSEKYISMLERGQRELKPIRRAYEAWVEAGLPLDWDRQAFEAERKMDSKKHLAK